MRWATATGFLDDCGYDTLKVVCRAGVSRASNPRADRAARAMTSTYADWNQRQDQIVIPFSTRVNLDELFGDVHYNVVCERITPCKLAIYLLIQSLDELHQDVQPFLPTEHCSLLSTLYGVIEYGDISFLEVKRIAHWMDNTVRKGIYKDFVEHIHTYLDGDDISVESDVLLQTRPNVVNFVCSKSYLGMWLKKLCAEWSQHSTQRIFEYNKRFIQWVRAADSHGDGSRCSDPWVQLSYIGHLQPVDLVYWDISSQISVVPFEIESSVRARKWIASQMHLLQVCPSAAFPDTEIMDWCKIIRKNHADIVQVHLLEMLCHIRAMNLGRALQSLRLYFDYSMFRTEGEGHRDAAVDTNESQQLFDQMHALANLMTAITAARQCKFPHIVEDGVERALRCNSGLDTGSRCRLISDAAVATTSSIRLKHGFAKAARSIATALVDTNYGEGTAPRHETDAHAIAGVNMVYASVMVGEWDRAFHILRKLKSIFTPDINWQSAQYVQLCDSIISFDCAILRGQFDKCAPILEDIEVMDHAEAALRKALFLAIQGEITGARNFLETLYTKYETPSTVVVHMRLRLQLAMLLSAECRWSAATEMLIGVREEAISVEHRNIAGMALRRIGVVQMLSGDYESAVTSLTECKKDIIRYCSVLERAILSIALAKANSYCNCRCETVRFLNKARVHCRQAGAILLEKFVLHELALYYDEHGAIEKRDEIAAEFAELDERHVGLFDWNLV
ncbi:hypothetical protein Angca_006644 [Angiostrongylus cantonensis]|nr:hypothetical protein Angca_006644 [Angiostrongylus cantonensis]